MTNADKFNHLFGIYATELWAMPENDFLEWLNSDAQDMPNEPERKKGEWVRNFDGNEWYWFCSNCKEEWYEEDLWMGGNDFPNFCPNCGADMRGDGD